MYFHTDAFEQKTLETVELVWTTPSVNEHHFVAVSAEKQNENPINYL